MKLLILNGPNLNLLGHREPGIYGDISMEQYTDILRRQFPDHTIDLCQSNHEGDIIDQLHASQGTYDAVLLNPGGYTHTSVSIADAVAAVSLPVIEIHISSILSREEFRAVSLPAKYCKGTIMGFGLDSYRLGILSVL